MNIHIDWTTDEHYDSSVNYHLLGTSTFEEHIHTAEWIRGEWRSHQTVYLFPYIDPHPYRNLPFDELKARNLKMLSLPAPEASTDVSMRQFKQFVMPFIKNLLMVHYRGRSVLTFAESRQTDFYVLLVCSPELTLTIAPMVVRQTYFYEHPFDTAYRTCSSELMYCRTRQRKLSDEPDSVETVLERRKIFLVPGLRDSSREK